MPALRIVYDVDGWAFHSRAQALAKHAPGDFTVSLAALRDADGMRDPEAVVGDDPVDLLFVLDSDHVRLVREVVARRGWRTRVIGAWSNGWPRRLPRLYERYRHADYMVFNNRDCWEQTGRWPDTCALPNGVDLDVFRVTRPPETRRPRVLWTGSMIFRELKGFDDLVVPLARRLAARGVECDVHLVNSFGTARRTREEMADWYNSGTVLVCASEAEGTPNPALEAAACGCVVVSTRVGNMPELIRNGENGYLVARTLGALLEGVEVACARYPTLVRQMLADIRAWDWKERSRPYFALFRELATTDRAPDLPRAPQRLL